ncbi:hypothetical protein KR054_003253 [Drosophila jambulina]|nr:hypothetical protein KR054_003253 [Drosophila jambulina]
MSEESPMGAAPPPPPKTTTASGATMIEVGPWLTAAVVAAYATKALWVKLRHVASATRKQKLPKDEPSQKLESEDEGPPAVEQDEMLKHFESDAGPITRKIEL